MGDEKKKPGNGCLLAFFVFLGIIGLIIIGGYFYLTSVFIPRQVNKVLKETGVIENVKMTLSDAGISLNNNDIEELQKLTKNLTAKNVKNIIMKMEQKGDSINTADLLDIIDNELEICKLSCVSTYGGWEEIKISIVEQIDDRQVQKMAAYLKANPTLKNNLPKTTGPLKKTIHNILEEMKE